MNRLIRERAYLSGSLAEVEDKTSALKAQLSALRRDKRKILVRLGEIDEVIEALSRIQVGQIRPIRAMPRQYVKKHGDFRKELIRVLQDVNGPIPMSHLVQYMAEAFDLPRNNPAERERATELVRRPLNIFRQKGAVIRLPTLKGTTEGIWQWNNNYDGEA